MEKCPHCGSEMYYTKEYVKGNVTYFTRFDGEEADNGQMYDGLSFKPKSKYAWCAGCDKRLFKISK